MDNKFNNMLQEFLSNVEDERQLEERLQEFMRKYNNGEIEYENTPLDDAYEILEKAENTKNKTQAIKFAKEAYKTCNACFDAILFQVDLEDKILKKHELLDKGLQFEKERLEKEGYFNKDNIGHFYGIYETRPYIRGLYTKVNLFILEGKMTQAKELCKKILSLNENDNTGARYLLMAIYAYLEDEKEMLMLYDKYSEENLEMLFPLFALYYKLGNNEKANKYLKQINKENPHFIKFFKGNIEMDENMESGCYSIGDSSEVLMYFNTYMFLLITMGGLDEYVLENIKSK